MTKKARYTVIIFVLASLLAIILAVVAVVRTKQENPDGWALYSYGNNVALYNGEEIVEVYGSISLDNLTEEDKKMLENGIHFTTRDEAITAIEDYDG